MRIFKTLTLLIGLFAISGVFMGAKASAPRRDDQFVATGGMAITPANTDISFPAWALFPRGIMVGDAGTVRVTTYDGTVMNFTDAELLEGVIYPISVIRVHSTGTTATVVKVFW